MSSLVNPVVPLTDEQRKLVEDNHTLIYWYIYKKNPSVQNIDDIYGILALVLCRCAKNYKPDERAKFSTFVTRAFANEIAKYYYLAHCATRAIHHEDVMASLDYEYAASNGHDTYDMYEVIPSFERGYDYAELKCMYAQAKMSPSVRTVMYYKLYGEYSDSMIANIMQLSRERVRQLKHKGLEAMGIKDANTRTKRIC